MYKIIASVILFVASCTYGHVTGEISNPMTHQKVAGMAQVGVYALGSSPAEAVQMMGMAQEGLDLAAASAALAQCSWNEAGYCAPDNFKMILANQERQFKLERSFWVKVCVDSKPPVKDAALGKKVLRECEHEVDERLAKLAQPQGYRGLAGQQPMATPTPAADNLPQLDIAQAQAEVKSESQEVDEADLKAKIVNAATGKEAAPYVKTVRNLIYAMNPNAPTLLLDMFTHTGDCLEKFGTDHDRFYLRQVRDFAVLLMGTHGAVTVEVQRASGDFFKNVLGPLSFSPGMTQEIEVLRNDIVSFQSLSATKPAAAPKPVAAKKAAKPKTPAQPAQ